MAASLALEPIAKKGRKHQADRHLFDVTILKTFKPRIE
jgi:hypothetical protein